MQNALPPVAAPIGPITAPGSARDAVARSMVWTLLESVGLSGVSFVALVVFSRYLSPAEFGMASVALGIVQMLNIPVERLFHDALVQKSVVTPQDADTAFSATLMLGAILSLLCWFAGPAFARAIGQPEVGPILKWMGLSLVAMAFGSILIALQRRAMEFRPLALRSLIGRVSSAVIGIGMAMAGMGVWSLVAQQVLMVALASAALWIMASTRPRLRFHAAECGHLLRFGLPATTYLFAGLGIQRIFVVLVGSMLGSAAAGYFALAFRAVDMLRDVIGGAVSQLALPLFSRAVDNAGRHRAFHAAVRLTSCVMFPVFIGLAAVSQEVVVLVFGQKWLSVAPYVALMSLLTVQFFPRMFSAPLMSAVGRPGLPVVDVLSQVAFIVGGMFAIGHRSLSMAAAVWALRLLVSTPIDMLFLKRTTGLGFIEQWRGAFVPAVAALCMGIAVYAMKRFIPDSFGISLRLVLLVPTAALFYTGMLRLLDKQLIIDVLDFVNAAVIKRKGAVGVT